MFKFFLNKKWSFPKIRSSSKSSIYHVGFSDCHSHQPRQVITLLRHQRKDRWAKAELERVKRQEEKVGGGWKG